MVIEMANAETKPKYRVLRWSRTEGRESPWRKRPYNLRDGVSWLYDKGAMPEDIVRRLAWPTQVKNGIVKPAAFNASEKDRTGPEIERGLSVTGFDARITGHLQLDDYWEQCCQVPHKPNSSFGYCVVGVREVEGESLQVRFDPRAEACYGTQHYLLSDENAEERCPSIERRKQLALFATDRDIVRVAEA
ncbi:hypothetical protein BH11ARM2_BH11ARM2_00040 [soil metagenome]